MNVGVTVQGNPSENDVLNFTGDGATDVTVDLAAQTVQEAGFAPVSFAGVGTVNVGNGAGVVNVVDGASNNTLVVTPTGNNAETVQVAGSTQLFNVTAAGTFNANLTGANNSLTVDGGALADTLTVGATSVGLANTAFTNAFNFIGAVALQVNGGAGNDTFDVTALAIPVSVDGGDPIGVTPGDTLNLQNVGAKRAVLRRADQRFGRLPGGRERPGQLHAH